LGNEVQWHVPLQRMIQYMDVLISQNSASAQEAVDLAVPAIFLSERARPLFPELVAQGRAKIVNVADLNAEIALVSVRSGGGAADHQMPI